MPVLSYSYFVALPFANFSCHLLTFAGAFASPSLRINSIVSSIFEIVVIDGTGINVAASSACAGPVEEGCNTMIGFEVFFCRIWYFFSPEQRMAYPGFIAVDWEDVIESLENVS